MAGFTYGHSVIVKTDDAVVRRQLRDLDEPMCFFGEGPAERRDRLSKILAKLSPEERKKFHSNYETKKIEEQEQTHSFYEEGNPVLKKIRLDIADFSIRQCNYRLDMARIKQLEPLSTRLIPQQDLTERIRQFEDMGSYVDDDVSTTELKTLTSCSLNNEATLMATSCRSGKCKLWSIPDMEPKLTYTSDQTNANFIVFSPSSGHDLSLDVAHLASCSMDGSVNLWNLTDESPVSRLSGPQKWRVTRVRYHPSSRYLASCCSDRSWRLWDLQQESQVLRQGGHTDAVFDIAFHPDGSLAGSAGLDAYTRIWDLRLGRSIHMFAGHTKGVRTIDFSPDGYHLVTGSIDNSVKIWDLRQRKLEYTIPAHTNIVTTVMFEKENGYYLVTSSFDKTVKFWSCKTWAPIKTLDAYDDKVTKMDISNRSDILVSCYFKYVKLWTTNK